MKYAGPRSSIISTAANSSRETGGSTPNCGPWRPWDRFHLSQLAVTIAERHVRPIRRRRCCAADRGHDALPTLDQWRRPGSAQRRSWTHLQLGAGKPQRRDYVDLTGEPQWMRRMIDPSTRRRGAPVRGSCTPWGSTRSRPTSGNCLHPAARGRAVRRRTAPGSTSRSAIQGAASGGTIASMLGLVAEARSRSGGPEADGGSVRAQPDPTSDSGPRRRRPRPTDQRRHRPVAGAVRHGGREQRVVHRFAHAARPSLGTGLPLPGSRWRPGRGILGAGHGRRDHGGGGRV